MRTLPDPKSLSCSGFPRSTHISVCFSPLMRQFDDFSFLNVGPMRQAFLSCSALPHVPASWQILEECLLRNCICYRRNKVSRGDFPGGPEVRNLRFPHRELISGPELRFHWNQIQQRKASEDKCLLLILTPGGSEHLRYRHRIRNDSYRRGTANDQGSVKLVLEQNLWLFHIVFICEI